MEKISGIIPSNARTRSVDVSNSQPVRPGAPTWGRPTGRVTATAQSMTPEDRVTMSATDQLENAKSPVYNNKAELTNKVEATRAKVVDELAKKFFEGQAPAQVAKDAENPLSERVAQRYVKVPDMAASEPATE